MLILLLLAVLLLTYSNGANDNFKGVATLWGSGTLQYRPALILATLTTFAGSICSYFFAAELIKNFSGKGLVPDDIIKSVDFVLAEPGCQQNSSTAGQCNGQNKINRFDNIIRHQTFA